jgi:peptidoglycan hydrolase-like protein with peptidoglycan-binding domain
MKTKYIINMLTAAVVLTGASFAVTAQAAITTQLDFGAQGSNVTELQTYLATRPAFYPSGLVTGYFGEFTQGGVQKFQTNYGIVSEGTPESTGYGRVGPITLRTLHRMIDPHAPLIYPFETTTTRNSATMAWMTNEQATSRVMYAKAWPFVYATAPSVEMIGTSPLVKITLTNLEPDTTYYYVRESVDEWGNIMWMEHESFKTDK